MAKETIVERKERLAKALRKNLAKRKEARRKATAVQETRETTDKPQGS